jgi:hypothetical protein
MKTDYYYISYVWSANAEIRGRVIEGVHPLQWAINSTNQGDGRFTIVWWIPLTYEEFKKFNGQIK